MRILRAADPDFEQQLAPLLNRTAFDPEIERAVAEILQGVRQRGDKALVEYAHTFDNATLTPGEFRVPQDVIDAAGDTLDERTRKAIQRACKQVKDFSAQRLPSPWSYSPRPGVVSGERFAPLDRVGCYVPGGTAPLISTVLHTAAIAAIAGVAEIAIVTPPGRDGTINPAILYAAKVAGATEVYRLGGVYAIAALAFGTETVRRVEKIVGPGNAYVTAAKRQVYGYVALDLVAGPSEIMVIADDTANPRFIAADMLSQAEHGSGREQAVFVTTAPELIPAVQRELETQSALLSRADCVRSVLDNGVFLIEATDLEQAAELASAYAPEHLEIMTRQPESVAENVTAAGAIFLGDWTPEPIGDFVAGPSHVLPTGGAGRYFSGLTVEQFFRRMSVIQYQENALREEAEFVETFAANEGLDAHGRSCSIRTK
ncbi:MAG: histidinol dehydrogenase [Lentisphaeria bacterium]|nr:histidinol dehydrogenase [Lentisphaeria bacterium]